MTAAEMHLDFKIKLDKTDTLNYPNFEPEEVDIWLNIGQEEFIKQRYGATNYKRQGFEETQKRTDDLRILVTDLGNGAGASPATNGYKPNSFFFLLPPYSGQTDINGAAITDEPQVYWFAVSEELQVRYKYCNEKDQIKRIPIRPITHDKYNVISRNPFYRPNSRETVRLTYQDKVEVFTDGTFSPEKYFLRYIRKPRTINLIGNVNSEFSDHAHQEIVNLAVLKALENIESTRYQSNTVEVSKQE